MVIAVAAVGLLSALVWTFQATDETVEPNFPPSTTSAPNPPQPPPITDPPTPPPDEGFQLPESTFEPLPDPTSSDPNWIQAATAPINPGGFPSQDGCPPSGYIMDMWQLEEFAPAQLDCLQRAWIPVLTQLGLYDKVIPHYFYPGESAYSPCGTVSAPAFYCPVDGGAIYFGEALLRGTSVDPIWGKDLVGHEYGHHLQAVSGILEASAQMTWNNEIARRVEIQATCFAFGAIRRDNSIVIDQEFYDSIDPHLRHFLEDGIHGSPDSLAYWGMRGFYAGPVGECNTWVVPPERVS